MPVMATAFPLRLRFHSKAARAERRSSELRFVQADEHISLYAGYLVGDKKCMKVRFNL